ncbi:MAG: hypothetical protein PSV22_02900 [Pseudolabrys sp.]|nr:hypothetical protein [Pseudolabrys sp.]
MAPSIVDAFYGIFRRINEARGHISAKMQVGDRSGYAFAKRTLYSMMGIRFFVGLAVVVISAQPTFAADWQYCLAPSRADHKVYMSATFPLRGALGSSDSAFQRMLDSAGLRYDDIQCPRADDERSIVMMMQYAISFNKDNGNAIIHLPLERTR